LKNANLRAIWIECPCPWGNTVTFQSCLYCLLKTHSRQWWSSKLVTSPNHLLGPILSVWSENYQQTLYLSHQTHTYACGYSDVRAGEGWNTRRREVDWIQRGRRILGFALSVDVVGRHASCPDDRSAATT
jgi:hypothetical protein